MRESRPHHKQLRSDIVYLCQPVPFTQQNLGDCGIQKHNRVLNCTGIMADEYKYEYFNVTFPAEYVAHVEINRPEKLNAFFEQ